MEIPPYGNDFTCCWCYWSTCGFPCSMDDKMKDTKMKKFKEYTKITEGREAYIFDTKPKTLKDAEDPEIQVSGFPRMLLSQYRAQFVRASQDFLKWAKGEDYEYIENKMSSYHGLLEGIQEIEKQMSKSAWKKKITVLKRSGK